MTAPAPPELSELRALAEGAEVSAPSPWSVKPRERTSFGNESSYVQDRDGNWVATTDGLDEEAFIAAANPATVLALLSHIDALQAEVDAGSFKGLALALLGYAVHDDDCTVNRYPEHEACSCGLRPVIREVQTRAALSATQGSQT